MAIEDESGMNDRYAIARSNKAGVHNQTNTGKAKEGVKCPIQIEVVVQPQTNRSTTKQRKE